MNSKGDATEYHHGKRSVRDASIPRVTPDIEPDLYSQPIRVEDSASLAEGFARKIQYVDPMDGSACEFVLCRFEGRLFALDTFCPHEGGRLSEGPLFEGRYAGCPLHLYRFDIQDGHCIGIECASATTYAVRESAGAAEVWVDGRGSHQR
jgi:nitrite reductase/ring-hydroxylating ferredoxin subunit